jgi:hypothetical protein
VVAEGWWWLADAEWSTQRLQALTHSRPWAAPGPPGATHAKLSAEAVGPPL